MRLVFAGTPEVALPSLRALLDSPVHEVVAVVTRPDAPAGRGKRLAASPVAQLARERGLPTLTPRRPGEPDFLTELAAFAPDCCPVVAYGALLPPAALAVPAVGWVNLHFSLLPAWRGAAPVQRALLAGDEVTGATTFLIGPGLDDGPVFGTLTEAVRPRDTSGELLARLADAGARLLVATVDGIAEGRLTPVPQPAEGISHAPKLAVDDVRVDWSAPLLRVDRLLRAASPAPGAWTTLRGARVKLGPGEPVAGTQLPAGRLAVARGAVLVGTATDALRLGEVQPEGRPRMAAADWARGAHPDGESFA